MGTALAKRSIGAKISQNPFSFFDADAFHAEVVGRLEAYAERVGGQVVGCPAEDESGEIFRVHLEEMSFPDGPGRGTVEVTAYRAFGQLRISLVVEHDRLFRSLDGRPGGRLFLHDYKFVRAYGPENPPSADELDAALAGVELARTAVQRRNDAAGCTRSPFARIRVALRAAPELPFPPVDPGEDGDPAPVTHRREVVIKALQEEQPKPVKIRIRRRKDEPEERSDD